MSTKLRALIVEDSEQDTLLLARELERAGYDLIYKRVQTAKDFSNALAGETWDIILTDYTMPRFKGTQALNLLNESGLDIPFIFVSGTIGEAAAVEAMLHGAKDYILKGNLQRLAPAVERELREAEVRREHRLAEDRLRVSEEMLRNLFEFAPDAILISDRSGLIVRANAKAEEMLGYSRDELIGKPVEILIPEALREAHVHHRAAYYGDPRTRTMGMGFWYDLSGRRKDGSTFPVDIGLSPLEIDGRFLVTAIIRDISERKRAEQELQARYQELQTLHEISRDVLNSLDLRAILDGILEKIISVGAFDIGNIRLLDPRRQVLSAVASRGYRNPENIRPVRSDVADEAAGMMWRELLASRGVNVVENVPASPGLRTFKKEGVQSCVGTLVKAGEEVVGTIQLGSRRPRKFSDSEIRLLEAVGSQMGIAVQKAWLYEETKASKSALELINQRLVRSLSDLSGLYTVLAPLSQANSAREMLDGIIERLMQATGADAALIRLCDSSTGNFILATQRGFPDYYLEVTAVTDTGSAVVRVFETSKAIIATDIASDPRLTTKVQLKVGLRSCAFLPLNVRNEIRGIIHLASRELGYFNEGRRDYLLAIARQMGIALENWDLFEGLKTSNIELERALGVKTEFLSVMSHELRTPLSMVGGYTAMIKDGMMGEVNPQQEAALQKVLNQTAEQLNMINGIMQTTQLETDSIVVERYPVNLSDFLDHLKSDYDLTFDKEGVTLVWDPPPEAVTVLTDAGKLRQILCNLINNAVKFTDRGTVTISARVVTPAPLLPGSPAGRQGGTGAGGKWVEVEVTDTGVGIPEDKLEAVFDKFYQVDSSETRLYGGVGLGLYIVKKFTELLGGTVTARSEPGAGSAFTVTLPLSAVPDRSQADHVHRLHARKKGERL